MNYDFDRDTPQSAYDALYEKPIGYVFSVNPDDYETVIGDRKSTRLNSSH